MMGAQATLGLILNAGLARRMGGADKGLLPLAGRPMLAYVAERSAPMLDAGAQRQRRQGASRRVRPARPR